MARESAWFDIKTHTGTPLSTEGTIITPQSQALTIRWPLGGFVWNRPVAVLVGEGEAQERIPIVDITLWVRVALAAFGLLCGTLIAVKSQRRRNRK